MEEEQAPSPEAEQQHDEQEPVEEREELPPTRDVETFWNRLDTVLAHLEDEPQRTAPPTRSFLFQPELLSVNSQDDIGTETENESNPFSFNTFTIRLVKPCLNVKGIQLLRASFPTPVTNIPDTECTFWYYRYTKWTSGSAYLQGQIVIDPTDGNFYVCLQSVISATAPSADPTYWAFYANVMPTNGVPTTGTITAINSAITIPVNSITAFSPNYIYFYTQTDSHQIATGQQFYVTGATTAGFNGTYTNSLGSSGSGVGTWSIATTNGILIPPGVSSTATITAGGTVFTCPSTAGLYPGFQVTISGATSSSYNGTFTVQSVTPTSFTISDFLGGNSSGATWSTPCVSSRYLYMIRLQPSWVPPELVGTSYAYNRTFTSYPDLVTELNKACADDPLLISPAASYNGGTFYFVKNDILFSYNSTYNKIVCTGQKAGYYYLPASYSDGNVFDLTGKYGVNNTSAAYALGQQTLGIVPPTYSSTPEYSLGGVAGNGQPFTNYRTLNLRLGWTWNGNPSSVPDYMNQFRPVPPYKYDYALTGAFVPVQVLATFSNIAPSYANLVHTGAVYVYLDLVGGSSQDSAGNGGLFATIPLNTPNNGVGFFDKVLSHKLTKIPSQIQEMRFTLLDEQGNPFLLPNSAVVNLEIGVEY